MTTANDLLYQTRQHLYSSGRDEQNKLAAAITDTTSGSLSLTYDAGGVQKGGRLVVDLEEFYVWSASGQTAVVDRGRGGSTAATHANGSVVWVNPVFSNWAIFSALNAELLDLSSPLNGLYQVKTTDLTYQAGVEGYDLTGVTDLLGILELRWKPVDISKSWPKINHYTLARNMATAEFASGSALIVYESPVPGRTIHVRYKAPFTQFSALGDDLTTTGLHPQAADILPLGAAIRLGAGREIRRNFNESQGDTRRATEVPAGANLNSIRQLQALRAERIVAEASRLAQQYPAQRAFL